MAACCSARSGQRAQPEGRSPFYCCFLAGWPVRRCRVTLWPPPRVSRKKAARCLESTDPASHLCPLITAYYDAACLEPTSSRGNARRPSSQPVANSTGQSAITKYDAGLFCPGGHRRGHFSTRPAWPCLLLHGFTHSGPPGSKFWCGFQACPVPSRDYLDFFSSVV